MDTINLVQIIIRSINDKINAEILILNILIVSQIHVLLQNSHLNLVVSINLL